MQALPEWRGQNTQQDGALSKQGSQKRKEYLCKFLVSKGVKMQKTDLLKAKGLADKHHLKAYDHAWQAFGLGFASFVGKNKCVAPKLHETRFTAPMSSLPGALQRKAAGRQARCCIKGSSTGPTRFEALWSDKRREVVDVADSGSIGFASWPFLFAHCKIRGCHFPNPLHRLHDDHNNATTASGLASMKTERIIVSNHKNGPWKQSGNFCRLQDAAMEYFSSANAIGELYLLMYPYIVVDFWLGQIFSDMGTPGHYDSVWRMPPDLECFSRVGESTNQLAHKCEHTIKYDSATLLVLLYCSISLGRSPMWPTLHWQEGFTSSISSLNERQHQVEPMEMHVRPKRMTRRSLPHQPVAFSSYQTDLQETVARDTKLAGREDSHRSLVSCFRSGLQQGHQHPQAFPSTVDDDVAHAARHAAVGY